MIRFTVDDMVLLPVWREWANIDKLCSCKINVLLILLIDSIEVTVIAGDISLRLQSKYGPFQTDFWLIFSACVTSTGPMAIFAKCYYICSLLTRDWGFDKAKLHWLAHLLISYIEKEICGFYTKKLTPTHPNISTKFKDNFSHRHVQTPWCFVDICKVGYLKIALS